MLFHASIGAREPARTAAVIAELWRGASYPFPAFPGSYIAAAETTEWLEAVAATTTGGGEEGAAGVPGRFLITRKRSTPSVIRSVCESSSIRVGGERN